MKELVYLEPYQLELRIKLLQYPYLNYWEKLKRKESVIKANKQEGFDVEFLGGGGGPKPKTVFKNKEEKTVDIYFYYNIVGAEEYIKELKALKEVDEDWVVNVHIASDGGYLDTTIAIVDAINSCPGLVIAHVAFACSAATIIALSCDKVRMADDSFFMIHNYSETSSGKGAEIKRKAQFTDKWLPNFFKTAYLGFLTEAELKEVHDDKDFWFTQEETNERLKRISKLLE